MKGFTALLKYDLLRRICSKLFLVCIAAAVSSAAITYKDFDPYHIHGFDPLLYHPSLSITPYVCSLLILAVFIACCFCHEPTGRAADSEPPPEGSPIARYISRLAVSLIAAAVVFMLSTVTMLLVGHERCFSQFETGRLAGVFLPCFVMFIGFAAVCVLISVLTDNTGAAVFVCIGFIGALILISETQLHYLGQPRELIREQTTESTVYNEQLGRFEITEETTTLTEPNPDYAGEGLTNAIKLTYYLNPARCLRISLDSSQYPTASQLEAAVSALRTQGEHPQSYSKRLLGADELDSTLSSSLLILAEAVILLAAGTAVYAKRKP